VSARIDRQLYGRCARQGEPGSYEVITSIEDELTRNHYGNAPSKVFSNALNSDGKIGKFFAKKLVNYTQRKTERTHIKLRKQLQKMDEQQDRVLAFSGNRE